MLLKLDRIESNALATLGELTVEGLKFYTLEDPYQPEKIAGKTRIPAGEYEILLRTFGNHHEKYKKKFPDFHRGMLWLQDVTGFTDILIQIGNYPGDTKGFIMVGNTIRSNTCIGQSTAAYIQLYKWVIRAFERGELVIIRITDNDDGP